MCHFLVFVNFNFLGVEGILSPRYIYLHFFISYALPNIFQEKNLPIRWTIQTVWHKNIFYQEMVQNVAKRPV
jgi:hypothetical protein